MLLMSGRDVPLRGQILLGEGNLLFQLLAALAASRRAYKTLAGFYILF